MKTKEILNSVESFKSKVYLAHRIKRCSPQIREAIVKWSKERSMPLIELGIKSSEGDAFMVISSDDLVNLYGMEQLQALLFLDDLHRANQKDDKSELMGLLGMLQAGKKVSKMIVSDEILATVREKDPEVWIEYEKIVQQEDMKMQELSEEYEQIKEVDI